MKDARDRFEIDESSAQLLAAWRYLTEGLPRHSSEDLDGVSLIFSGEPMALLNLVALSSPAREAADLERRARIGVERAAPRGLPWLFGLAEGWAPGGDLRAAEEVMGRAGLRPAMVITGMAADSLTAPRWHAPELTLRRVADEETRLAVADINSGCYDIPIQVARATMGHPSIWGDGAFGRVGYVGGKPVCCAGTFLVEGVRYVGYVATAAEHRRKGYGEIVMRQCLEDALEATGARRTVLHATEMGRPVYEAMGYRTATRIGLYVHAR